MEQRHETYGVLVGWTHQALDSRIVLRVQSMGSQDQIQHRKTDDSHFLMTRAQAGVLGTYLLRIAGQEAEPKPARTWFRRMFG